MISAWGSSPSISDKLGRGWDLDTSLPVHISGSWAILGKSSPVVSRLEFQALRLNNETVREAGFPLVAGPQGFITSRKHSSRRPPPSHPPTSGGPTPAWLLG